MENTCRKTPLLKLICAVVYSLLGIVDGALLAGMNIYSVTVALVFLLIVLAVSYGFGLYYKVVAEKKFKF